MNFILNSLTKENNNLITGTSIKGGETLQGVNVNYSIAEALRTLPQVESFSEGKISYVLDYIPTECEGFIYKHNGFVVFMEYSSKSGGSVETLVINKAIDQFQPYQLIQALILLDLVKDKSTLRSKALKAASLPVIDANTPEMTEFLEVVQAYNRLFRDGAFDAFDSEIIEELDDSIEKSLLGAFGFTSPAALPATENPPVPNELSEAPSVERLEDVFSSSEPKDSDADTVSHFEINSSDEREYPGTPVQQELKAYRVSRNIRTVHATGVKLREIALAADVAASTVSDIMNLKRPTFNMHTLSKIQSALDTKFSQIPNLSPRQVDHTATVQADFVPVIHTAPIIINEEKLKKERPKFYDDTWVVQYLKSFEINPILIDKVIKFRSNKREVLPKEFIIDVEPKAFYAGAKQPIEKAIVCMLTDVNLVLKGEAGSGKTTLIQSLSALFNTPLFTINGSDESNVDTIVGIKELENRSIIFKPGRLVLALEAGGIFYADEANMIRPNILAIINGATDHRKELYNELTGKRIKGHADFRFMASINEDYEDTRAMNRATVDRSVSIEMTYMGIEELKKMLAEFDMGYNEFQQELLEIEDISRREIIMLANIATALQNGVKQQLFSPEVASIRNIVHVLKLTRLLPFKEAVMMIVEKYPKEERTEIATVLSAIEGLEITADELLNNAV